MLARSPLRVEDDVGDLWELRWPSGGVDVPGVVSREKEDAGKENRGDFLIIPKSERRTGISIFSSIYLNRVRLESDRGVSAEENIFVPEKVL